MIGVLGEHVRSAVHAALIIRTASELIVAPVHFSFTVVDVCIVIAKAVVAAEGGQTALARIASCRKVLLRFC